jgi:hypothetical protein
MDQHKWCGIRFVGLLEPLTDCSRSGVSSLCGRLRVDAVVSDPIGGVHRTSVKFDGVLRIPEFPSLVGGSGGGHGLVQCCVVLRSWSEFVRSVGQSNCLFLSVFCVV